jgi:hypothetical protein
MKKLILITLSILSLQAVAQTDASKAVIAKKADAIESKIIGWRRDFHEHPELGNREVRTSAAIIAKHLQALRHGGKNRSGHNRSGRRY